MTGNNDFEVSKRIYAQFVNPDSDLFLQTDAAALYKAAKEERALHPVTRDEIHRFRQDLEIASRSFERRVLKNRPRSLNFKSYISFAPKSILAGDLCFLPTLRPGDKRKKVIIAVYMDIFSRCTFLAVQKTTGSRETAETLEYALAFFGCSDLERYRLFVSDRGLVSKTKTKYANDVNLRTTMLHNFAITKRQHRFHFFPSISTAQNTRRIF